MPGTSGRIAASQAAKQPKTCGPSYPSLDLVRELPRARGVGESELTRTRERPRQAQLKAWAFDAPSKAHEQLGDDGFDTTSPKQGLRFRRIIVGGSRGCYIVIHTPFKPLAFSAPHYSGDVDAQCLPKPRAVRDTGHLGSCCRSPRMSADFLNLWCLVSVWFAVFYIRPGFFIWFCWHPIRSYMNTLIKNYIFHTLWTPLIKTTKYISKVF